MRRFTAIAVPLDPAAAVRDDSRSEPPTAREGRAVLYESAHVRVESDDGIATLWLDFPGDPPNLLTAGRVNEIGRAVEAVGANPFVEILVVRSAKPAGFSGGYDPGSLLELGTDADRRAVAAAGQRVTRRLAVAPFVSLAFLEGLCLGAGLELALACDHRLAVATPSSELGFPEVPNCFVPGWGGITRLVRLIGAWAALGLVLSGRPVPAREARAIGLVDHAFCLRRTKIELRTFLDRLQDRPRKPRRRRWDWLATERVIRVAREATVDDAGLAAIHVAEAALRSEADGLAAERRAFAALLDSPAARAGLELLRRAHRPAAVRPGPRNPVQPFPDVVGVVGVVDHVAEEVAIRGGRVVSVGDSPRESPCLSPVGKEEVPARIASGLLSARLTPLELDQAAARIRVNTDAEPWAGFAEAGLVFADADAHIPGIEAHVRPRTVIAVAGQPVAAVQELADRPGRIAGLAFPVLTGESNLVEVIAGPETDPDTLATLADWTRRLGFLPVVVSDRPNQVVRRLLAAMWDEAVRLEAEGAPADAVDRAAVSAGFHRGPLATIDAVGFAAARPLVPRLAPLVAADLTGRPGEGFYLPDGETPNLFAQVLLWEDLQMRNAEVGLRNPEVAFDPHSELRIPHLIDRLTFRVVNEAAAALGDESHAGPAEIDLAAALGADLLRSHGGPLRFADAFGLRAAVGRLGDLASAFGRRFQPHPELVRRAAAGERVYESRPPSSDHRPPVAA
jgi:3-hydroxyacyl-CoA dehydrogenase/enoyl-CoA hydratase/3-hydroxybutyryl-CoA epimerase